MGTMVRSTLTDDDGSGLTGSIVNNSELQKIYDNIDTEVKSATNPNVTTKAIIDRVSSGLGVIQTTTSTGSVNDLALNAGVTVLRCTNASLLTLTGLAAGVDGQRLLVVSVGAGQVDLAHQNAGSVAANRLINFATSGSTSLAPGTGTAEYEYDGATARWRLINHEQGAWITPTFSAGNYTANGVMTWTLTSGDVTTQAYWLKGRTLTVQWYLQTTTVGGTANIALYIGNGAWGGFTAAKAMGNPMQYTDNSGTVWAHGHAFIAATATVIQLYRVTFGTNNWTLSTDLNYQMGQLTFEVQ